MSDKPASPARGRKKTAPPAQQPPQEEVVVRLPLADLYPFPDHPFQVRDDEEMVKPQGLLGDINFKYIRQRMEHREKSKEAANE